MVGEMMGLVRIRFIVYCYGSSLGSGDWRSCLRCLH